MAVIISIIVYYALNKFKRQTLFKNYRVEIVDLSAKTHSCLSFIIGFPISEQGVRVDDVLTRFQVRLVNGLDTSIEELSAEHYQFCVVVCDHTSIPYRVFVY